MNPDTTFAIAVAPRRDSRHWEMEEVTWGEMLAWLDDVGDAKEAGNYLLGTLRPTTVQHTKTVGKTKAPDGDPCTNIHRNKQAVVSRSALALDVDYPDDDFLDKMDIVWPSAALVHTTFSSSPDAPRYRLLIPTDREMAPDEYMSACTVVMDRLGKDQFDRSTREPERYMFLPAAQQPDWFDSLVVDGDPIVVDELLEDFQEDLSGEEMPTLARKKRDPFELDGAIGAFNRAYEDLALLIEEYELPYEHDSGDRWHLVGARSVAGMGPVTDGVFYSHHAHDPAFGQTCTAFDLVRLHRFGDLDEDMDPRTPVNRLPSQEAMLELASVDARVIAELVGVDFKEEMDDEVNTGDWRMSLRMSPRTGKMVDHIDNWDLITRNEPAFRALYINDFTAQVEVDQDLPWRRVRDGGPTFTTSDRVALGHHIEREFNFRPPREFCDGLVNTTAARRVVNPVRDYLDSLIWDGTERIETCLPGVPESRWAALVARKSLVAAVARVYEPGCKWDHTLVLFGKEGLGKSFWIDKMSRGYSASLGRINDKDTLLTMQRSWIMVSDEGHSLRKSEADATKEFLTRREDVFRLPYEREAVAHPRHCVIWSTTNDEVFLRRQEGNRRFWIVHCEERVEFERYTDDYIDQLWAEAVVRWRAGEILYLTQEEAELAEAMRQIHIEENALAGVIQEYLSLRVPDDWDEMSIENRAMWVVNYKDGMEKPGVGRINVTCTAQIWVEAMGRRFGDHKRTDLLEISKSLRELGWVPLPARQRVPGYGPQTVFVRPGYTEPDIL